MRDDRPPPPPPPPSPATTTRGPDGSLRRPGDLTLAWRATLGVAWLATLFAYAATWQVSVQLGLATWWVGPRSTPTPALVRAIPFAVTVVGMVLVVYGVRRLSWWSLGLASACLLIALPDFSTSVGLALLEVAIAASMMVVSAASLTGRYREADPQVATSDGSWSPSTASEPGDDATGDPADVFAAPPPPPATGSVERA